MGGQAEWYTKTTQPLEFKSRGRREGGRERESVQVTQGWNAVPTQARMPQHMSMGEQAETQTQPKRKVTM
jgi:hypothetical protein